MKIALVALGGVLIFATLLPLVRASEWWVRACDFPRTQIAVGLTAVIGVFLVGYGTPNLFEGAFLVVLAGCLVHQGYRIFPYTPLASRQVMDGDPGDGESAIRLLIANVLVENRRADDFLALVRAHEPDVILAVETDQWWAQKLAALDEDYPHTLRHPLDNAYGMHFFSRLELGSPELRFLIDEEVPSIRTGVRLRCGDWIDFYGLHPRPPTPPHDADERDAELLIVGKEVRAGRRPAIVAGDLNDVAWSHTTRLFQEISGALDPRIGRGMFSTFHARYPIFRWPLDHIFHEESFTLGRLERLGFFGSDHFPVLAELCYEPKAAAQHEAPVADADDRREAEEKIRDGREAAD